MYVSTGMYPPINLQMRIYARTRNGSLNHAWTHSRDACTYAEILAAQRVNAITPCVRVHVHSAVVYVHIYYMSLHAPRRNNNDDDYPPRYALYKK